MKKTQRVFLVSHDPYSNDLKNIILNRHQKYVDVIHIESRDTLCSLSEITDYDVLISYSTNIIIPQKILELFKFRAYNFHAASPDFPGRDPHHFAVYNNVKRYGATAHIIREKVDSGEIIGVEYFDCDCSQITPHQLLEQANHATMKLANDLIQPILENNVPKLDIAWGAKKNTRQDFLNMCELSLNMGETEIARRIKAFSSPHYDNFKLSIQGKQFALHEILSS